MGLESLADTARHHALRAMALTWAYGFVVVLLPLTLQWGFEFSISATKIAIAAVVSALIQAAIPLDKIGEKHLRELAAKPAQGRLVNVADEMAIATGHARGKVLIHDSEIPNIGGFPTTDGVVVMATSGAVEMLDRYELQALVAAQFAGLEDKWCRRATKAEFAWGFIFIGGIVSILVSPFAMLTITTVFFPRWVEHARDLCADVAAVRATRHPDALATGLRDLRPAARSANKLKVGTLLVSAGPFMVLPKRIQSTTTSGSGKGSRSFTSADEIAFELALRADRAEALAAGGDPREFTGKEFRRRFAKLGLAPSLTPDERSKSMAMAQSQGVKETDPEALAGKHFPPGHPFWDLQQKVASEKLGFTDMPRYLMMLGELHSLEASSSGTAKNEMTPPPPQQPPPPPPRSQPVRR